MITHLVAGPGEHGVRRYAERLAELGAERSTVVEVVNPEDVTTLVGARVLCHFTDRLFGADARSAARRLGQWCRGVERLTVVLHDIPQVSDGVSRRVRAEGYLAVCELADRIVVNSAHEALLLRALARCRGEQWAARLAARTQLVPLPVPAPVKPAEPGADRWAGPDDGRRTPGDPEHRRVVATLGFIYPGKGLEEVIDAAATVAPAPRVLNLGRASPGHEDLIDELTRRATAQGVAWASTGWLSDEHLASWLRSVDVPVAAHRHLSASGSINTWLGAGRRPLVTPSRYTRELSARMPGSLHLVDDLGAALAAALAHPPMTWRVGGAARPGMSEEHVASRLAALAGADA